MDYVVAALIELRALVSVMGCVSMDYVGTGLTSVDWDPDKSSNERTCPNIAHTCTYTVYVHLCHVRASCR